MWEGGVMRSRAQFEQNRMIVASLLSDCGELSFQEYINFIKDTDLIEFYEKQGKPWTPERLAACCRSYLRMEPYSFDERPRLKVGEYHFSIEDAELIDGVPHYCIWNEIQEQFEIYENNNLVHSDAFCATGEDCLKFFKGATTCKS